MGAPLSPALTTAIVCDPPNGWRELALASRLMSRRSAGVMAPQCKPSMLPGRQLGADVALRELRDGEGRGRAHSATGTYTTDQEYTAGQPEAMQRVTYETCSAQAMVTGRVIQAASGSRHASVRPCRFLAGTPGS